MTFSNKLIWAYDNQLNFYNAKTSKVTHTVGFGRFLDGSEGWIRYCSNSHRIEVPKEPDVYKSLAEAKQSCEDFENQKLEELERYEFDLDRKSDD